ncbi:MAG TPA: glycosyltransferase family 2 protein [Nitrosomonas sp.]|nr:glycosyltransferase family 2 protein [Nitrosomonas sp.]
MKESIKISVALPTKNRSHMVLESINCVLKQTYENIELLIADNSDDDKTSQIVGALNDIRIKYIKTGDLSMSQNWDVAISNCTGEYVYVIGDKILLKSNAIEILVEAINKSHCDVYTFNGNPRSNQAKHQNQWNLERTDNLIKSAISGDISNFQINGFHGYSLIVSKSVIDKIRSSFGRVIFPLSPDYTLAFIVALNTSIFYCNRWCSFDYNYKASSNGFSAVYNGPLSTQLLSQDGFTSDQAVDITPIPIFTVWNSVFADFLRTYNRCGYSYDVNNIDIVLYWKNLFRELVHYSTLTHIDMSDKFIKLYEFIEKVPELQVLDIGRFIEESRTVTTNSLQKTPSVSQRGFDLAKRILYRLLSKFKK